MPLRMSISTSSACRPESSRRPSMSTARARPSPTIAPTEIQSSSVSPPRSARSITSRPVIQTSAICAACEPIARMIEIASPVRYGFRNASRRKKMLL